MTIILLNFLIALISQKYEEAMMKLEIIKTKHKAELNAEYFISLGEESGDNKKAKKGRIFIL